MGTVPTVEIEPDTPGRGRRLKRRFYVGVGLAVLLLNVAAFAPPLIDPSHRRGAVTPVVAAHGLTFLLFLVTFVTQAGLVAAGRTDVHRRVGIAGGWLAALVIVLGVVLSIQEGQRGYDLSGDLLRLQNVGGGPPVERLPLGPEMMANFNLFGSFAILVGLAIWFRRRPEIHKRLMVLAMLGVLTNPPLAHLVGHWESLRTMLPPPLAIPIILSLLAASAIHDKMADGRVHPVSLWGPVGLFAWVSVWNALIIPSEAGERFATWLIGGQ